MAEYIDKQKAIDAVSVRNLHPGIINALQSLIVDIPAADVAPVRHGRWIECKPYNPEFNGYECSECGAKYQGFSPDNYCANCGAKMDGEA